MPAEAPAAPAADQQFFAQGIPVEVGKIQRELKTLWQDSHEVATRASRLNLVIFSTAEQSLRANTALVEAVARQHALRALLIASKPQTNETRVRAWVNAHCQISKNGQKQRCSEQIAIQLEGDARTGGLVPNLVFSNLDSDLPLYFWRQGHFSSSPSEQLMAWVDCLIYDSADWPEPGAQFAIVKKLARDADLENGLADLNWTRLRGLRGAVAQFFDAPDALRALTEMEVVELVHSAGAGSPTRALLFVGWLASQLGWRPNGLNDAGDAPRFRTVSGQKVAIRLHEGGVADASTRRVTLRTADGGEFTVSRDEGSDFFSTCAHCGSASEQRQMLPVGAEDLASLVSAELVHGGGHKTYLRALAAVEEVWQA